GRQLRYRAIATLRLGRQRASEHALEIPAQRAQLDARGGAMAQQSGERTAAALLDEPGQLCGRLAAPAVGPLPRQQEAEEHAQGVDVRGGAQRIAAELLRARPLGGERTLQADGQSLCG